MIDLEGIFANQDLGPWHFGWRSAKGITEPRKVVKQ